MSEPSPKITELTDFPDRFSPMLVKELRQGLRTNLFVTAFILLQGFMILCILMNSAETGSSTDASSGFFWFFIIVTLVIVQPLRGFSALSSEYQLNSMDLIQLTRLDAWRITWGKWLAINAQTLLLVAAVVPYLVLRYFFGSINIISDLGSLGLCTVASAFLSGITVGCSALKNLIIRLAVLIGSGVLFGIMWAVVTREILNGSPSSSNLKALALLIVASLFGTYFFLAFGASKISPGSENLSTLKRLVGVAIAIGAWAFQFFGAPEEVCNGVAGFVLSLILVDAVTEEPPVFRAVLPTFTHPSKRWFAYLLSPGWHTGILFFSVVFGCVWAVTSASSYSSDAIGILIYGAGVITFPLIIIHLFFKNSPKSHFGIYLFVQCCLTVLAFLCMAVADTQDIVYLIIPLPLVLFFGALDSSSLMSPVFLSIGGAWVLVSLLIPLFNGKKLYREMADFFVSHKQTTDKD